MLSLMDKTKILQHQKAQEEQLFKNHSKESVRVGKGMGDYIAVDNEVPNDNRKLVVYNDDDSISFAPKICDNISLQRMSVSEVKNWLE